LEIGQIFGNKDIFGIPVDDCGKIAFGKTAFGKNL